MYAAANSAHVGNYSYRLELSASLSWSFEAVPATAAWLSRFAQVLGLRRRSSARPPMRIIIARAPRKRLWHNSAPTPDVLPYYPDLPQTGWSLRNLSVCRLWTHPKIHTTVCEIIDHHEQNELAISTMRQVLFVVHMKVVTSGGIPVHGALAACKGRGALLIGASGAGKSTCSRYLSGPWQSLSDDEALVIPNDAGSFTCHPLPTWSDLRNGRGHRTMDVADCVPLTGAFFLEQSDHDEIIPTGRGETTIRLYQSAAQVLRPLFIHMTEEERSLLNQELLFNACTIAQGSSAHILCFRNGPDFRPKIEKTLHN